MMMDKRTRARHLLTVLEQMYPEVACSLDFASPLQLLVATQLAAQSTDARVNLVTPALFRKYPTVEDFAAADLTELEQDIHSTGFFRNKAKNLKACCMMLLSRHQGEVPDTLEALVALPGVGRKTANVVLGTCFGVPGIIVDTHAGRLSRRMGLTRQENPEAVERELMKLIPRNSWTDFSHRLVAHGRAICTARKPQCGMCACRPYCQTGSLSRNDS
jgi:endonuclease III